MSTNILLYGEWKGNLGDDLFVRCICDRYPKVTFHIFTDIDYAHIYEDITNLRLHFTNNKVFKGINILGSKANLPDLYYYSLRKTCDAAVFLGGSLYQQEGDWMQVYRKRKEILDTYGTAFVIGGNFGPYTDSNFFDVYHYFFSKMKDVCFRDSYSAELFSKELDNVRCAPDVVLGLPDIPKGETFDKLSAVISVIDLGYDSVSRKSLNITPEDYEKWIAGLALVLEKKGFRVTLMGFCGQEGDHNAIVRIMHKYAGQFKDTHMYFHGDVQESLALLNGAECIFATRLHAMILAWRMNKAVLPLVYDKKMLNVLEEYDPEGYYLPLSDLLKVSPEEAFDNMSAAWDFSALKDEAEKQFSGLDKWLAARRDF